jgi:hypothetical protein
MRQDTSDKNTNKFYLNEVRRILPRTQFSEQGTVLVQVNPLYWNFGRHIQEPGRPSSNGLRGQ